MQRGDDTTIPCHFDGYEASSLDLSTVSVRWTLRTLEGEKLVYGFNGGHHTRIRTGSQILKRGLVGGDASLYIPNLQLSDDGEYTCTVIVTPDKVVGKVILQVSVKPTCTVSDSRLEMTPDTERSVTCNVNGLYPEIVRIRWVKYSKASSTKSDVDVNTCTKTPVQNHDGTYSVTSVLSIKPTSLDEDGDVYSCVIIHRSLKDGLTLNIVLSVQPEPDKKVPVIIGSILGTLVALMIAILVFIYIIYFKKAPPVLDPIIPNQESYNVGDYLELSCKIHSFHPQYINVMWFKEEKTLPSQNIVPQEDGKETFFVTSCVDGIVKEEDFGKVFRCKVMHEGITDKDASVTWRLKKQGHPCQTGRKTQEPIYYSQSVRNGLYSGSGGVSPAQPNFNSQYRFNPEHSEYSSWHELDLNMHRYSPCVRNGLYSGSDGVSPAQPNLNSQNHFNRANLKNSSGYESDPLMYTYHSSSPHRFYDP
ncbi:signal-regulatory protein beta-1-like [Leptodactylus fuscus]